MDMAAPPPAAAAARRRWFEGEGGHDGASAVHRLQSDSVCTLGPKTNAYLGQCNEISLKLCLLSDCFQVYIDYYSHVLGVLCCRSMR